MAIAHGGYARASGSASSHTISTLTVSGSNTIGFVGAFNQTAANTITSITWNGSAMTVINSVSIAGNNTNALYYVIGPTNGDIIANYSEAGFHRVDAAFYTGAAQSSPIDANNTFTNTASTSLASTLTSTNAGDWMVVFGQSDTGNIAASTGLTLRSVANDTAFLDSNAATGSGSVSGTFTAPSGKNSSNAALFLPFTAAATATGTTLLMMGV